MKVWKNGNSVTQVQVRGSHIWNYTMVVFILQCTQKYHPCFALDPELAACQLLVYMVWCCPLSSMCQDQLGRFSDAALHTGSQHEALSTHKDNSGLHIHIWAPLRWSDVMFAQMCGSNAKRPNPKVPLWWSWPTPDWERRSLLWLHIQSNHGWHDLKGQNQAS